MKAISNKIKQNKAQYDSDRQTANISALSWGNVTKYEFLTGKLEKATTMKRFQYSPLSK